MNLDLYRLYSEIEPTPEPHKHDGWSEPRERKMFVSSSNQLLQTFTRDFWVVFPKFWFSETPVAMNRNQCSMHSMYQQCISMLTYYQRWSCMVSFLIMPIFNNYPKTTPFPPTVSTKKTEALCPRVWRSSKHPKHLNPRSQNIPWLHLSWSYPQTSAHPKRNISTFSLKTMGNFFFETCWCDVRFFSTWKWWANVEYNMVDYSQLRRFTSVRGFDLENWSSLDRSFVTPLNPKCCWNS